MGEKEKWKEALTGIAIEETEKLERSLTSEEREKAEALYHHHQKTILRQIRKRPPSIARWAAGTAAAAAVILLLFWGVNRSAPDFTQPAAVPGSTGVPSDTGAPQITAEAVTAMQTQDPASGIPMLKAQLVDFPAGMKYAVYTGPGDNYERANQNKAVVSTNDWIQVFGVENGYAMIQYAITSTRRRIGYIDAASLPGNTGVNALEFGYVPVVFTQEAELTDDPLGEKIPLHTLPAGTEAGWLAVLDDWAYLEWNGGSQPVRGFVPAASIRLSGGR